MKSTTASIAILILFLLSQNVYSQTLGIMDNGQQSQPSTINLNAMKAVATADVLICDTIHGKIMPTNGFNSICFNVVSKGSGWIDGVGVVISSTVAANNYLYIYKRPGSAIGNNLSSSGWIFVDSVKVFKGVTSPDTLSLVTFTNSINLLYKDTVGLFIGFKNSSPLTLKYDNSPLVLNAIRNQDWCLEVRTGYGGSALFNASQSPRDLGGFVKYCCLPGGGTGMKENEKEMGLKFFPNPASDFVTVSVESKHFYVEVYNVLGEMVLRDRSLNPAKNIDVKMLSNGSYTIKVFTDSKKMAVKQLIITR